MKIEKKEENEKIIVIKRHDVKRWSLCKQHEIELLVQKKTTPVVGAVSNDYRAHWFARTDKHIILGKNEKEREREKLSMSLGKYICECMRIFVCIIR